jgi:hypothetical protein
MAPDLCHPQLAIEVARLQRLANCADVYALPLRVLHYEPLLEFRDWRVLATATATGSCAVLDPFPVPAGDWCLARLALLGLALLRLALLLLAFIQLVRARRFTAACTGDWPVRRIKGLDPTLTPGLQPSASQLLAPSVLLLLSTGFRHLAMNFERWSTLIKLKQLFPGCLTTRRFHWLLNLS